MLSRAVAPKGERSMEGTMIWFNPAKRHGFIQTDEGERLRVDEAGLLSGTLLGDRCRGMRVRFDRLAGSPFIAGIVSGRLDRGELDPRLQEVLLRGDDAKVETLFFHVGSRQSGFVLRPDEFERGCWQGEEQLVVQLGNCVVSVLVAGELGRALER